MTRAAGDGVPARLVPIEGAEDIFTGHADIDGVVRLSVEYFAQAIRGGQKG